ncbi:hypothetical protein skT53_29520 [Effusibacillus dendaii]|uniref:Multidrug resistance protein MdtA-like barrel-sandwich hybrid domain-containing protein n=1 Tax=Effusibacillus dendaii TaxID=2743772 RepID=A0A7I8DD67_9BACL|nr:hypothetical protein skT53_29520 [Effusibacillus dendaii]
MWIGGKDAVSLALEQKGSILTAGQVNVSFQQVSGKVADVKVQEEQRVKKGDVLMTLDPTDIDLQIAQLKSNIESTDIKIKQTEDSIRVDQEKIRTHAAQAELNIATAESNESKVLQGPREEDMEKQRLAVEAAKETFNNAQLNYNRTKALFDSGAVPKTTLDSAQLQLTSAQNTLQQQEATYQQCQPALSSRIKTRHIKPRKKSGWGSMLSHRRRAI